MKRASFRETNEMRSLRGKLIPASEGILYRANINFLFLFLLLLNQLFQFFFSLSISDLSFFSIDLIQFSLSSQIREVIIRKRIWIDPRVSFIPYNFRFDKFETTGLFFPSILESRHTPRSRNRVIIINIYDYSYACDVRWPTFDRLYPIQISPLSLFPQIETAIFHYTPIHNANLLMHEI